MTNIRMIYNHLLGKFDGVDYEDIKVNNELFIKELLKSDESAVNLRAELLKMYKERTSFDYALVRYNIQNEEILDEIHVSSKSSKDMLYLIKNFKMVEILDKVVFYNPLVFEITGSVMTDAYQFDKEDLEIILNM